MRRKELDKSTIERNESNEGSYVYSATLFINKERGDVKILKEIFEEQELKDRAFSKIYLNRKGLFIEIFSKDASSLRALLNSYLRILQSSEGILKINEKINEGEKGKAQKVKI